MHEGSVRAFLALEIPESIKSRLAAAREELRHELPRARWTRLEGWHLTLKFLGEVDRRTLDELSAALAPRLRGLVPVTVELGNTGFFPTPSRPRVAWVGGTAEGAEKVVAVVEEVATEAGFARERRGWSVHLTMARLKAPWPSAAVDRFLEWGEQLALDAFICREAVLFESDLQPGGAVYTALERFSIE
jgi:2'-5' RNA ligase